LSLGNLPSGDPGEGRGHHDMEPLEGKMTGTSSPESVSTRLQRVAELSKRAPAMVWTTLSHHIDLELLRESYRLTRKDGAAGVDGQTAKEYAENLTENLQSLLHRFKSGTYKAQPVRRVYIPKGEGSDTRPIGIPTFEDKILQRAVVMVLNAIYEQDFLNCSYGFRPSRSAHQALKLIRDKIWKMNGSFVLDVDIQKFFDTLDHQHLRKILDKRVRDGVIRRAIDKWLKAGVFENGNLERSTGGTPQGGVVSPVLSNIFLHEVLDTWFNDVVKPRMSGKTALVRFADDFVIAFANERDAKRVMAVLGKRFEKFGLKLHPTKTRLVVFKHPKWIGYEHIDFRLRGPETFDFLGFTQYWAKARKDGRWIIKCKTARKKLKLAIKRIFTYCKRSRHFPIQEQQRALVLKLRGHYQYYGVVGNSRAINSFYYSVRRSWQKWLNRRSNRRNLTWDRFELLMKKYPLPTPRIVHRVL